MTKEKVIPQIRFSGFTDTWEQRKFREQYQKITEKNDLSFGADKIISVANMYFKSDVKQSDDDYMRSYNIMRLGDIAFEGNKSKHFAHGRFVENTIGDGIVSHVFDVFRPIADYDLLFWKYLINYEGVMGRIMTRCTKASTMMTNLVADDFLAESILVPSIQEQQKIGAFLDKLDSLITLHQRKYDKLTKVKKAMLEKMFPENGSPYPEIRFKGFTDAWKQRKLGDTVQITMGQSPDGSTYSDVPSDYILVQGNADLQNGWVSPRVWTSQMTKKADAGDLIMSVRAPAGAMGKTAYNAVIGRGVAAIKGNEFIYQLLEKMDSDGYWKALSCGSTFESLNSDNIKNADVLIPDVAEQEKIGEYFLAIDRLITLHQRKLEKLKNIKKACLEKMFV